MNDKGEFGNLSDSQEFLSDIFEARYKRTGESSGKGSRRSSSYVCL
jgi:hypothetical protein